VLKKSRVASSALLLVLACFAVVLRAQTPMVKTQAPGYYRMMLGAFEFTALSDGTNALPAASLLINVNAEDIKKYLARAFLTDPVETSHNAFLVNTGTKLVLVDTGAGALMGAGLGKVIANLQAAGYQPGQIDEVYVTHMHTDHIGGLIANGQRAFPNATVRAAKAEADYWLSATNLAAASAEAKSGFQTAMDMFNPYIKAGKFSTFDGDVTLVPGIRAVASHGHTPGHTFYVIESQQQKLVCWGDLVHVGAVQFPQPSAALKFDSDSKAAISQRAQAFKDAAAAGYWVAGAHLSFPGIGHLRAAEPDGYVWVPANYSVSH